MKKVNLLLNTNALHILSVGFLIFLFCFASSAYSQNVVDAVSVELQSKKKSLSKNQTFNGCLKITNNTQENIYFIVKDDISKYYNKIKQEVTLGLDEQPVNFHYFEFPKLIKIKPKSKFKINLNLPISDWKFVETGKWKIKASIGILEEEKLKNKLKDLGFSLNDDDIQMTATDFLILQTIFYSNNIFVSIFSAEK